MSVVPSIQGSHGDVRWREIVGTRQDRTGMIDMTSSVFRLTLQNSMDTAGYVCRCVYQDNANVPGRFIREILQRKFLTKRAFTGAVVEMPGSPIWSPTETQLNNSRPSWQDRFPLFCIWIALSIIYPSRFCIYPHYLYTSHSTVPILDNVSH
jgi:hypothetical protein